VVLKDYQACRIHTLTYTSAAREAGVQHLAEKKNYLPARALLLFQKLVADRFAS
jgi:hypothetical protein